MPSPSGAVGPPKAGGCGGGKTASTGAGSGRSRADEDLALGLHRELAFLVARDALENADAALVLGLVVLFGHGPLGAERIARPHRRLEPAMVLEIGDRRAREVHADRRGDEC